jgi:DNA topoisomerase IA
LARSIAFLNTAFDDIGTDATIAQHIQTIVDREYVIERMDGATKHLLPSTLGIGLVEGYNQIGFDRSLSKPQLRREVCVILSFVLFRSAILCPLP